MPFCDFRRDRSPAGRQGLLVGIRSSRVYLGSVGLAAETGTLDGEVLDAIKPPR